MMPGHGGEDPARGWSIPPIQQRARENMNVQEKINLKIGAPEIQESLLGWGGEVDPPPNTHQALGIPEQP